MATPSGQELSREKRMQIKTSEKLHISFVLTFHWPNQVLWHGRLHPSSQEVHPSHRTGRRIGISVNCPKARHCCNNRKWNWKVKVGAISWSFVCKTQMTFMFLWEFFFFFLNLGHVWADTKKEVVVVRSYFFVPLLCMQLSEFFGRKELEWPWIVGRPEYTLKRLSLKFV